MGPRNTRLGTIGGSRMRASLRALLHDILDYAGLFPPAKLDLDTAIRNYARYANEPEAWMLARFICPASRLCELFPYVEELFGAKTRLRLSVLGSGGNNADGFIGAMRDDLQAIADYTQRTDGRSVVDAFEVRLPTNATDEIRVGQLLDGVSNLWSEHPATPLPLFVEPPVGVNRQQEWPSFVRAVAQYAGGIASDATPPIGVKLRCGGPEPSAFPLVEAVASAIWAAHVAGVPLKFTAGLHHPLRHFNQAVDAPTHGFLNLFASGVLAASGRADERRVREIIECEEPDAFRFTDEAMSWKDICVKYDAIADARRRVVTSFGSCSFDQPREDLCKLGWM